MKKYEKIIRTIVQLNNASNAAFEKKMNYIPRTEEWKACEELEDALDLEIRKELSALQKCINWYRQRAKTAEDIKLIVELEEEYSRLYENCVCDLNDEEVDEITTTIAMAILQELNISADNNKATENAQKIVDGSSKHKKKLAKQPPKEMLAAKGIDDGIYLTERAPYIVD